MPVRKNHPEYEVKLKDWITPIVAELDEATGSGGDDAPEIIEDYQAFSEKFSVRVMWSRWEGVPVEDRVPIILEAYKRSKRTADLPKITHARGLTSDQQNMELVFEGLRTSPEIFGNWSKGMVKRIPG